MKNVTNNKVQRGDRIKGIIDIFYHCLVLAQAQYNEKVIFFNMNIHCLEIMKTHVVGVRHKDIKEKNQRQRGMGLGLLN
jgi:hypothetical protein